MSSAFSEKLTQDVIDDYQAFIYPLKAVFPYLTQKEWKALLEQISMKSNLRISEVKLEDQLINAKECQAINKDKIVVSQLDDRDNMAVFARISDSVVVKLSALQVNDEIYFSLLIVQFVAPLGLVALFALLVMFWQQYRLNKLESISLRLARGEFAARAPTGWLAIGDINQRFNYMADKLERIFKSQKHIMRAVSHELKTPLFRIQMQLSLIQDEPHNEQIGDYLSQLYEDIEEIDELVRELLYFSKIERLDNFNHMFSINLAIWLPVQVKEWGRHCRHHLTVSIAKDIPALCLVQKIESKQLKRALDNLVFNAEHFANSHIHLSLFCQHEQLCLSVEDDGVGIAFEYRQHIFEPFFRLESDRNRDMGGVGLGLAIVKEIIRCHGASITVTDSQLGGACF